MHIDPARLLSDKSDKQPRDTTHHHSMASLSSYASTGAPSTTSIWSASVGGVLTDVDLPTSILQFDTTHSGEQNQNGATRELKDDLIKNAMKLVELYFTGIEASRLQQILAAPVSKKAVGSTEGKGLCRRGVCQCITNRATPNAVRLTLEGLVGHFSRWKCRTNPSRARAHRCSRPRAYVQTQPSSANLRPDESSLF